jgi:hypothetical protein
MTTLLAAGVLALAVAGFAGAAPKASYSVRLGDTIEVLKTHILCTVQKGGKTLPAKTLIGCVEVNSKGPVVGSYAVGIDTAGAVTMARVRSRGGPLVVFKRTLSAVGAGAGRVLRVRNGDVFVLGGSDLACSINRPSGGRVTASCFLFRARKLVPGSYAVGITDLYAFVSRVESGRTSTIVLRRHGA